MDLTSFHPAGDFVGTFGEPCFVGEEEVPAPRRGRADGVHQHRYPRCLARVSQGRWAKLDAITMAATGGTTRVRRSCWFTGAAPSKYETENGEADGSDSKPPASA